MRGVCWKVRFYLNSKHRLGSSPRVKIEGAQKRMWRNGRRAGFRFQWRDSCGFKSRHPHQQKRYSPCGCAFFVYKGGGFEIGRKLHCNLCEAPNSLNDCLAAKAATGGNPVTCTKKVVLFWYDFFYPLRKHGIFAIRRADTTNSKRYRKRYASRVSVYKNSVIIPTVGFDMI